ncbi:50S ribosomal protein L11 methyltransferase [Endozoicomonas numazuensis]|uniref:Ribosomal protein L11 methyltransferase n=1 Tax=Endozoicomonas numazuensis TaxID=1137799 RepID=A0A081NKE7_9GAMM|nr:50S ribosomal protein L11 methyltransferase [Endozoicomonas numazuensis]KEQ18920.1 ribosomal protein L11 methyltransferase [Endozoicomonas numazuensis]
MPWIQIKLDTSSDHAEELEDLLLEAGASAVTLQDGKDQPLFEPEPGSTPLWHHTMVIGLFDAHTEMHSVIEHLQSQYQQTPFPSHKIEIVEDKDWEREWMTHFVPMQFGTKLWVCPSWKEIPEPDAINLMLDPGLAFGTGTHPTTALCLEWLEKQDSFENQTVIDYGCGSGILAIAALLLGAKTVTGVDLDPQALEATVDNAERNKIAPEKLKVYLPDQAPEDKANVVIANILAGPLVELAPKLAGHLNNGGKIALSGILSEQKESIVSTYSEWFDLEPVVHNEDWILVTGTRKD